MSYLTHLKRAKHHRDCRWIVKYNQDNSVREVKLVHNPTEYREGNSKRYGEKARPLHTIKGLIKILENDKEKRNPQ